MPFLALGIDPWLDIPLAPSGPVGPFALAVGRSALLAQLHQLASDFLRVAQAAVEQVPDIPATRARAMLQTFASLRAEFTPDEAGRADAPIMLSATAVTSPLLLATACIVALVSRGGFEVAHFHDVIAAEGAADDLSKAPGSFAKFAALLIALVNLWRTATGDAEVACWSPSVGLLSDVDSVALAMAELVLPGVANDLGLLDGLALFAIAYGGRNGAQPNVALQFGFRDRVRAEVERRLAGGERTAPGPLVSLEFGRSIATAKRLELMIELAHELRPLGPQPDDVLLWGSLGRFWTARFPRVLSARHSLQRHPLPMAGPLVALIGPRRAEATQLVFAPKDSFELLFGVAPPTRRDDAWAALARVVALEPPSRPLSVGWVQLQLERLAQALPESCFAVEWLAPSTPPPLSGLVRCWLPRSAPSKEHIEGLIASKSWRAPQLLVARTVAALRPNMRLLYGEGGPSVRTAEATLLHNWSPALDVIAHADGSDKIDAYVSLTATPRTHVPLGPGLPRRSTSVERPLLLGIDVGGKSIKVALFELGPRGTPGRAQMVGTFLLKHRPDDGGSRYRNARDFVAYITKACSKSFRANWRTRNVRLIGAALGWPGAVRGAMDQAWIAGPSSVIDKFAWPVAKPFWDRTALELHGLQLREALEHALASTTDVPLVLLTNDGNCHGLAADDGTAAAAFVIGAFDVQFVLGTGVAIKPFDHRTGRPIPMPALFEIGRTYVVIDNPLIPGGFPLGTANQLLRAPCLSTVATELLKKEGYGADDCVDVPALLLAQLLDEATRDDPQLADPHILAQAVKEGVDLGAHRQALCRLLAGLGRWSGPHELAHDAARLLAQHIADVMVTLHMTCGAAQFNLGGGTLSGAVGRVVHEEVCRELRGRFRLSVQGSAAHALRVHALGRTLVLRQPATESRPDDAPSGARGAIVALLQHMREAEPQPLPLPRSARHASFTWIELGHRARARLEFPGREKMPPNTLGYVRSMSRDAIAREHGRGGERPPYRDYDRRALTSVDALVSAPYEGYGLVTSLRNTLNEFRCQIRLQGQWWRRDDDPPVPPHWPVLVLHAEGAAIQRLVDVEPTGADIAAALPLVMDYKASSRAFLAANCSDVSHLWNLDPMGRTGSSAAAWASMSELWEREHSRLDDEALLKAMEAEARSLAVEPARHRLHGGLAIDGFGRMFAFAISGSLEGIANHLTETLGIRHAIIFDNGGSTCIHALTIGASHPTPLVAGANYRDAGTAFLVWEQEGFLNPVQHPDLDPL